MVLAKTGKYTFFYSLKTYRYNIVENIADKDIPL